MTTTTHLRPIQYRLLAPTVAVLLLLLAADLAFVGAHLLTGGSGAAESPLRLESNDSYAEAFQVLKALTLGVLLMLVSVTLRTPLYAVWAIVLAGLLINDVVDMTVVAGTAIGAEVGPNLSLSILTTQLISEVTIAALLAGAAAAAITWSYRSAGRDGKSVSGDLLLLLLVFVFFDLFFEPLQAFASGTGVRAFALFAEGAGELLAGSLIVAYAFGLLMRATQAKRLRTPLNDRHAAGRQKQNSRPESEMPSSS